LCVLSRNVPEDDRYADGQSLILQRVLSMMCVPLLAQGNVIGALYVDSRGGTDKFDEKDLELLAAIGNQAGIALQRARLVMDLENLFFSSIRSLVAAIDAKDQYTHGHSERVTAFALMVAKELKLSEHDFEVLRLAGLLHDVGKIGVPEEVLNKPGDLTDEEFEQVKLHPSHGAEIISNIQSPYIPEIVAGVRHHHERWDGTGYPDGLKGEESPLIARLLTLADAFDAMTSDRPYRKGFSIERALQIVRDCAGSQFDPHMSEALCHLHERGELLLPKSMALKYTTMATPKLT
jgi:putative nucleotidyltransferase with HDIG domain